MTSNKALIGAGLVFILMFILGFTGAATGKATGNVRLAPLPQATPAAGETDTDQAVRAAFQAAVAQNRSAILGFQIYDVVVDRIQYSSDGATALLWLSLRDRVTGEVVASEPGLSIASNPQHLLPSSSNNWSILLQSSPTFTDSLRALPSELLTQDVRDRFLEVPPAQPQLVTTPPLSGYKLPWTAGLAKSVTNTIGHVYSVSGGLTSCPTSCRYAFDFADGTMFPMLAAKGGTVRAYKTTCPNYGSDCTNYLILEDPSTSPTSYQLYYHMANESIPQKLRTIGSVVEQGDYIGDADDTGFSTGNHLHYHVYLAPTGTNYSWGNSVDITFDDVSDNGGRPRTCAEAQEYPALGSQCQPNNKYVSGNIPTHPPVGSLNTPPDHQTINNRTITVSGSASDEIQVTRIQVVANYDGSWKAIDDISPNGNGPYSKDVDLCSASVPDGPLSLTVRIFNRAGSMAQGIPVRQLIKNYSCAGPIQAPPPPACAPSANQVALYADTDFRGACTKFDVNNSKGYTADLLGAVGDNNASSIQVGSNVRAILFDRSSDVNITSPLGRVESFSASDASFSDNRITNKEVSGLWVVSRDQLPRAPILNPIGNKLVGNAVTSSDSLVLSWDGGGGATTFDAQLTGPGTNIARTVTGNSISVGNLAASADDYTFTVTARNEAGTNSSSVKFKVTSATLNSATDRSVPYSEGFDTGANGWSGTGLWRLASVTLGGRAATQAWIFNNGTNYADATYRAGDLTSPPIVLPSTGTYYLRFAYYMDTEDGNTYWDQRFVQVSADGGPFEDLVQLSDDRQGGQTWWNYPPVNLQKYAGKKIRLRFHLDTIDQDYNAFKGWAVDDVSINTTAPDLSCASNHNTPTTAQAVSLGSVISGVICPQGDIDYYKVIGKAGQPITIDINARTLSPASKLDSFVELIDADQRSVLAENDDEVYITLPDSLLKYTFTRDGTYYIKVKAWNNPSVGGPAYFYQMDLSQTIPIPPKDIHLIFPQTNAAPNMPFIISASATDYDGGTVARVDFYWHGPDWSQAWVKLGSDTNGADGWSYNVDPRQYGGVGGSALYVQAVSRTGGVLGTALWDLTATNSVPVSHMYPLPTQVNSTVVQLTWQADDPQNMIDHFDLQYQVVTGSVAGAWTTYTERPLPGSLRSAWFDGVGGNKYNFRLRAVNVGGIAEAYPDAPEATTSLAGTCTPDPHENGQGSETAIQITSGASPQQYNICKSIQDGAGDVDWFYFNAQAGDDLLLLAVPQTGGAKLEVSLYDTSSNYYGSWISTDYGAGVSVRIQAPAARTYYVEVKPTQPGMYGTDMTYQMWVGHGYWIYYPYVGR